MCFSPLAGLRCLYTCRQEERIRDVRYRMSQTHLHSISQMFPLHRKLWNPFILSSHSSSSKVLLGGFMKLEERGVGGWQTNCGR